MKIGVFSYGLPEPGKRFGGIECVAHDLAEGLCRRGHRVIVWTYGGKPPEAHYEIRPLPFGSFVTSWAGRRLTMGYLGNLLACLPDYSDCDVVLAHGDSLLLPLKGPPVVRIFHGSALGELRSAATPWRALGQGGVYLQELLTARLHGLTVGVSESTRKEIPYVSQVIPNGVDRRIFFPDPSQRSPTPLAVCIGTLDGRKRGRRLVEWFHSRIRPQVEGAELVMVTPAGDPVPGVSYVKGLSRGALAELLRRAWVYASPSRYEGFGLPYLEALASGTPVVATPNPGSQEVLENGKWGELAEDEDFPERVVGLLKVRPAGEVVERALERASQLDLEGTLDGYEAVLADLTKRA